MSPASSHHVTVPCLDTAGPTRQEKIIIKIILTIFYKVSYISEKLGEEELASEVTRSVEEREMRPPRSRTSPSSCSQQRCCSLLCSRTTEVAEKLPVRGLSRRQEDSEEK